MARMPSPRDEMSGRTPWRDEDVDPWLDEADPDDGPTHTLVGRRTFWFLLLLALALLIGLAIGIWLITGREKGAIDIPPPGAELPLMRSPGAWKELPPEGPATAGIPVEGQGQTLFGTGDGRESTGRIALEQLPEAPIERPQTPPPVEETPADDPADAPTNLLPETPKPTPAPEPKPVPKPTPAPKPEPKPATPKAEEAQPAAAGSTLQLGAFSTEARARAAWKVMADRFSYIAGYEPIIASTARDGKTLYRLRIAAPTPAEARDICARLKVAGEACTVVN